MNECTCAEDVLAQEFPPEIVEYFKREDVPDFVRDYVVDTCNELIYEEARQAQFVSDVSHEIRTPLTAIRGAAETLLEGGVPEDMAQRFLGQIVRECDRLTRLANDLLTLQRAEGAGLELARINLRSVADNCALLMEGLLEERGVNLEVVGEAPDVDGNADGVNQILVNLIENASRYAGEDGHVREHLETVAQFLEKRRLETLHELDRTTATVGAAKPAPKPVEPKKPALSYEQQKAVSREERRKKERVKYLESEIGKAEGRMKEIETILSAPPADADIMELTREYLELKRDLDALTDEWGSLI